MSEATYTSPGFNGTISLPFGSRRHLFRLTLGGLEELQDRCDAGPMAIYERLCGSDWRLRDLRETIRLGLIGAGLSPAEALVEIERYTFPARPLAEAVPVARAILLAALTGPPDDPPGKSAAADGQSSAPTAATDSGASPTSTAPESASLA